MPTSITVRAFAKINLDLRVLGIRPDGYHELRTTFQSIALADRLTFTPSRGPFRIECDDPTVPTDRTNLIWKAADLVSRHTKRRQSPFGITVRLEKNIPMQAGLGGGSSDAAAALRVFARMWGVSPAKVIVIARRLGADVRFFLEGGTALGIRRGDVLVPFDPPLRGHVVIVVPAFGVSTKDAYGWLDRDRAARRKVPRGPDVLYNDLEAPVAKRHPEISRIVAQLRRLGAVHAAMSGSGSAVFGVFKTAAQAGRAASSVRGGGRRVEVARMLTRRRDQTLAAK